MPSSQKNLMASDEMQVVVIGFGHTTAIFVKLKLA